MFRRCSSACEITGADAVHPGYGFLSENARFAEILGEHNVHFIGPRPEHIRLMGDKIAAKRAALALGIPIVPGSDGGIASDAEAFRLARDIGFPLMLKAAAGGGGRGMKVIRAEDELAAGLAVARAESQAAFGDDTVYLEKYLERPRHIEIQVLGDGKGRAIHLGERDCSLQRRHQKVWEEGPSPALNTAVRDQIGETVAKAMREIKYLGVGTVEFLYEDGKFNFIEMNTRIQVEHPVTEMITDIDLVVEQIRVAAGNDLDLDAGQCEISRPRHRMPDQCRKSGVVPASPGKIVHYHPPGGLGVRVDSAVYHGYAIPPFYNSLVGKLIVHGKTRSECLMRLKRALDEFVIDGIETTFPCSARWRRKRTSSTATTTSTGWKNFSPAANAAAIIRPARRSAASRVSAAVSNRPTSAGSYGFGTMIAPGTRASGASMVARAEA